MRTREIYRILRKCAPSVQISTEGGLHHCSTGDYIGQVQRGYVYLEYNVRGQDSSQLLAAFSARDALLGVGVRVEDNPRMSELTKQLEKPATDWTVLRDKARAASLDTPHK